MSKRQRILAGPTLAILLLLAACAAGGSDAGESDAPSAADMAVEAEGAAGSVPAARADARQSTVNLPRSVIYKGVVGLSGDDVGGSRNDVQKIADKADGHITNEQTESDTTGEMRWARLVLRVPADAFDDAMTELESVGQLTSSDRKSKDVSTEVIDVDVRIRAQTASLKRIEALLAEATKMGDIVSIESELTRRQAELDSLKQRQAYLSDQTAMSTITVHIERTGDVTPVPKEAGFVVGLKAGWADLKDFGSGAATVAGHLLPSVVVLLIVGVPLLLLGRRFSRSLIRVRRRPAPDPAPDPAP